MKTWSRFACPLAVCAAVACGRVAAEDDVSTGGPDVTVHDAPPVDPDGGEDARDAGRDAGDTGTSDGESRCTWHDPDGGTCWPNGCAPGQVCLHEGGGPAGGFYFDKCVDLPAECLDTPTCACAGECVCLSYFPTGECYDSDAGGLGCFNGAVSTRKAKRAIEYIDQAERDEIAEEILRTRLATYEYRDPMLAGRRHLGFILEDAPDTFAADPEHDRVDLYGYTSMLLAAVQQQNERIEALEREVRELRRRSVGPLVSPKPASPRAHDSRTAP